MAQAESQPAPGQPQGRRRPLWHGRHGPPDHGAGSPQDQPGPQERGFARPRGEDAAPGIPQERPQPPDDVERAGVRLEHPVVAGYDGSQSSRHALAYAAGMARRLNRALLIVHVCPAGVYCEPLTGQVVGMQRDRDELDRWLLTEFDQIADSTGLTVCVLTRRGSPARELAATATEFSADALVIGTSTRAWRHMSGSVPGWLARHAQCPVMVVP
jgi:nucleotide-binding universal stress UspA family protein